MPPTRARLLLLLTLLGGAAACTRSTPTAEADAPRHKPKSKQAAPSSVSHLVGRSIDQVREQLGVPREARELAPGPEPPAGQLPAPKAESWVNTFDKDGLTIVVTFNARTRAVRDLMLLGSNEDELIRRAGLDFVSDGYLVLPVTNPAEPSKLMGVRVVAR